MLIGTFATESHSDSGYDTTSLEPQFSGKRWVEIEADEGTSQIVISIPSVQANTFFKTIPKQLLLYLPHSGVTAVAGCLQLY